MRRPQQPATRAGADGPGDVYRRRPSKADLVVDAVAHLGRSDVGDLDAAHRPARQGTTGDVITTLWDGLAGPTATVLIPLAPSAFAPLYGMLTDRYGVTWIVGADAAPADIADS